MFSFFVNLRYLFAIVHNVIPISLLIFFLLIWGCSNSVGPENDVIPSTTISFALVETSHIKVWVENAYQTRIITLVDEERDAGNYSVSFEMIDSKGNRLPSGLYTFHLETEDLSQYRAVILP